MEKEPRKEKTPEEVEEEMVRKELLYYFKQHGYNLKEVQSKGGMLDEWMSPGLRPLVREIISGVLIGDVSAHFLSCPPREIKTIKIQDLFAERENALAVRVLCGVFYVNKALQGARKCEIIITRHSHQSKSYKIIARGRERAGYTIDALVSVSAESLIFLGMADHETLDHDLRKWPRDTLICYLGKGSNVTAITKPEEDFYSYIRGLDQENIINRFRMSNVSPGKKQLVKIRRSRDDTEKAFRNLQVEE